MKFKTKCALAAAKISNFGLKLLHKNGSFIIGRIAYAIDSDFLGNIDIPKNIMVVEGTNGKTTTSNMIDDVLEKMGETVITNRYGSNTIHGIASSLIHGTKNGKITTDNCVLEVDELWSRFINPKIHPKTITITNVSQDTCERNPHVFFVSKRLNQGIPEDAKLILNASDGICAFLGSPKNEKIYYNVKVLDGEEPFNKPNNQDFTYCPNCGHKITWDFKRYGHQGKFHCENCGLSNPKAKYEVYDVKNDTIYLEDDGKKVTLPLVNNSMNNIFNQLAAYATLRENGYIYEEIAKAMSSLKVVKSRFDEKNIGNKRIINIVAKGNSPVASSLIFKQVGEDPSDKTIIYIVDEEIYSDHMTNRNPGWLHKTDLNFVDSENTQIILNTKIDGIFKMSAALQNMDMTRIHSANTEDEIFDYIDLDKKETIYIMHDMMPDSYRKLNSILELLNKKLSR